MRRAETGGARRTELVPRLRAAWSAAADRPRPPLLLEVLLLSVAYLLYGWVRNAAPTARGEAVARARDVLLVQDQLGLGGLERGLNDLATQVPAVGVAAGWYYATLHFALTGAVLVWLYVRHPEAYRPLRRAWWLMNAVALVGFYLYPLAPPRLLPGGGFTDTVVETGVWGSWANDSVAAASNQYAAMPSLHAGWAIWCGLAVAVLASRSWVRTLAVVYPVTTVVVTLLTANHYLLDAVAGAAVLALALAVVRATSAEPEPRPARRQAGQLPARA